ncbi:MgtC/SapB family protein [Streptomyces sp. NPDC048664]|uniref:MgtC/SapB family protein n=1 Tax=Streptomyces sp. NPDC048664 TaxID=3154505 RepID=UPI00342D349D
MPLLASFIEPSGQGWSQVADFAVAFVLSGAIGAEREIRQKAAGLRTYTIVGIGAALFTQVSAYGFADVLRTGQVVLDPSRVAAQIVVGLGFIGAGLIFVQHGSVRGLTTAASVWLTAAVGTAAAAGLPLLAALTTAAYFVVSYLLAPLLHRLPRLRAAPIRYRVSYLEGAGALRELVRQVSRSGFSVVELVTLGRVESYGRIRPLGPQAPGPAPAPAPADAEADRTVEILLTVEGIGDTRELTARLVAVPGVLACSLSPLLGE